MASGKKVEEIYPLTPSQSGMFYESMSSRREGLHIEQGVWEMGPDLQPELFERAWQSVAARHPVLRTAFAWRKQREPLQIVLKSVKLKLDPEDLSALPPPEAENRISSYLEEDRRRGFELNRAPLTRIKLFRTPGKSYTFIWTFHHILLDGWSQSVVVREVMEFYRAFLQDRKPDLKPVCSYRQYFSWLNIRDISEAREFWSNRLKGFSKPTPPGKPAEQWESRGSGESREEMANLDREIAAQLDRLVREEYLTRNAVIQGAWGLLLSRYNSRNDVVFGSTVSGRPAELDNVDTLTGMYINTIPVRLNIEPRLSVREWLKGVMESYSGQMDYQYCPAGQIHQWSEVPGHIPLYHSLLVFENYPGGGFGERESSDGGSGRRSRSIGGQTRYPVTAIISYQDGLEIKIIYDSGYITDQGVADILEDFTGILIGLAGEGDKPLSDILDGLPDERIPLINPGTIIKKKGEEIKSIPPRNNTEQVLAEIWSDLLGTEDLSVNDNFFRLGGHSLLAAALLERVKEEFGRDIPISTLFNHPTIEDQAAFLLSGEESRPNSPLVPIQPRGSKPPFFCMHPAGGVVFPYFGLVKFMDKDQPFYGLQDISLYEDRDPHETIQGMAAEYVKAIREIQPEGPYFLGGWSLGGVIAFEVAQHLRREGAEIGLLALFCIRVGASRVRGGGSWRERLKILKEQFMLKFNVLLSSYIRDGYFLIFSARKDFLNRKKGSSILDYLKKLWTGAGLQFYLNKSAMAGIASDFSRATIFRQPTLRRCLYVLGSHVKVAKSYRPESYPGRIVLFRTREEGEEPALGWDKVAEGGVEVHMVRGNHLNLFQGEHVDEVAAEFKDVLEKTMENYQERSDRGKIAKKGG